MSPRDLYEKYSPCVLCVTGITRDGDEKCGTAFHIGDGWLVTARHVFEELTDHRFETNSYGRASRIEDVLLPDDSDIDLAILKTDFSLDYYMNRVHIRGQHPELKIDHIPMPAMLSDNVGTELVMTTTVTMGYPPIPLSNRPELVAARGEIMAVIDKPGISHPFFINSAMPRGGFSGGPVISEYDFLLGVQTESLVKDNAVEELGYGSTLSVEPIWNILFENKIFPASCRQMAYAMRLGYGFEDYDFQLTDEQRKGLDG